MTVDVSVVAKNNDFIGETFVPNLFAIVLRVLLLNIFLLVRFSFVPYKTFSVYKSLSRYFFHKFFINLKTILKYSKNFGFS